jgi:hypothetical protein
MNVLQPKILLSFDTCIELFSFRSRSIKKTNGLKGQSCSVYVWGGTISQLYNQLIIFMKSH